MPRLLKCPRCSAVNTIEEGERPACANCGFGSGPPVPPPGSSGATFTRVPRPPPEEKKQRIPVSLMLSIGLLGLGVVALLTLQFSLMHWSTGDLTVGGASTFTQDYNLWNVAGEGTNPSGGPTSYGYWDSAAGDLDGIWLMRMGGPLLLVATLLAGVACTAAALRKPGLCNAAGWAAAAICAVMVIVLALGIHAQQDQVRKGLEDGAEPTEATQLDFNWAPGFFIGIASFALVAAGTTLGPVRGRDERQRPEPQPPPEEVASTQDLPPPHA